MRRATVLAASAAAALLSALGKGFVPPNTASGWYAPPGGFKNVSHWAVWSQRGKKYACFVTPDGHVTWEGDQKPASAVEQLAVETALAAELKARRNEESIDAISERLAQIDWGDEKEAEVIDTTSGQTTRGTIKRTPDRFAVSAPGVLSGGGMSPDGVTIQTNAAGRASLLNWNAPASYPTQCLDALGDMLDGTKDSGHLHYVLTRFGEDGALHYTPVGRTPNPDPSQFEQTPSKVVTIKGSTSPGSAGKFLASTGAGGICWTNVEAGVRVYADRTRMPPSSAGVFALGGATDSLGANFAPPENWAGSGLALEFAEYGSSAPMRLALSGLPEADEGTVPTADGNGGIEWKPASAMAELRVTGTDGNAVSGTNLVFRTAEDSDVRVTATVEDGAIVLTFGVYYR